MGLGNPSTCHLLEIMDPACSFFFCDKISGFMIQIFGLRCLKTTALDFMHLFFVKGICKRNFFSSLDKFILSLKLQEFV